MSNNAYYLFLSILLFPVYVSGQDGEKTTKLLSNWSVHAKYGIPYSYNSKPTYGSFETSIAIRPKAQVIIGAGYRYFFREKLSLDVDFSYEYASFLRLEEYSYQSANNIFRRGERCESFQNHSLLTPLKLTRHFNKISLSIGVVYTFHLASQVNIRQRFFVDGQFSSERMRHYAQGDRIVSGAGSFIDRTNVDLETKINIQGLLGLNYKLTKHINLNLELRQYLMQNRLVLEIHNYDVSNPAYRYYYPFVSTFSVGMSFDFKHKEAR